MSELEEFVQISRFAGQRFDLVQAGGGNSSVKLGDGSLLIKASGFALSEVGPGVGNVRLNNAKIVAILRDPLGLGGGKEERDVRSQALLRAAQVEPGPKPSIETFLHALLYRHTLHTHPLVVNAITCRPDWESILIGLFPEALCVKYQTPGIELALELQLQLAHADPEGTRPLPNLVFLQNHGLIVSYDDPDEVIRRTEEVLVRLEAFLKVDMKAHKHVTALSRHLETLTREPLIVFRSRDRELARLAKLAAPEWLQGQFCPDGFVFGGYRTVRLGSTDDLSPIDRYYTEFKKPPKVLLLDGEVYLVSSSLRKAREVEDVFSFHLQVLELAGPMVNYLSGEELQYLATWESEKYREKLHT